MIIILGGFIFGLLTGLISRRLYNEYYLRNPSKMFPITDKRYIVLRGTISEDDFNHVVRSIGKTLDGDNSLRFSITRTLKENWGATDLHPFIMSCIPKIAFRVKQK